MAFVNLSSALAEKICGRSVSSRANSEVRNNEAFGVLKLTLHPTGYDWVFISQEGKQFTDSGSTQCH